MKRSGARISRGVVGIVLLPLFAVATPGGSSPPPRFVDHGACPFECCRYGDWSVEKDTILRASPKRDSTKVATLKKGMTVEALTGDVVVVPSHFRVKNAHGDDKPGDVLWVYTYTGEGSFKVWRDGQMREEDLGFSAYPGGIPNNRCTDRPACWGALDKALQMTWWIKLRDPRGIEGWSNEYQNFSGSDACG